MKAAVIGLGKLGLPIAVQIATKGIVVSGCDIDPGVVAAINAGVSPVLGELNLDSRLAEVVRSECLSAHLDAIAAVADADVVIVVVPLITRSDGVPDFTGIDAAVCALAPGLKAGALVIFETTLPIGTTRNRFAPMLEEGSGLRLKESLHVAFSPERVLTGRVFEDLRKYPKLVGGVDDSSAKHAADFYRAILDFDVRPDLPRPNGVWDMGSCEAAEFVKLAETTYRDVNIALANEFTKRAAYLALDFSKIVEAANSQPFSHIHAPGIAVGGHCIPVYPQFFLAGTPTARVVRAAREVNLGMPEFVVHEISSRWPIEGKSVAVLGAAYRGSVKEVAFSGVHSLVKLLENQGAVPFVHDPLYSSDEIRQMGFRPYTRGEPGNVAILQADHPEYLGWQSSDIPGLELFFDGRNFTSAIQWLPAHWFSISNWSRNK